MPSSRLDCAPFSSPTRVRTRTARKSCGFADERGLPESESAAACSPSSGRRSTVGGTNERRTSPANSSTCSIALGATRTRRPSWRVTRGCSPLPGTSTGPRTLRLRAWRTRAGADWRCSRMSPPQESPRFCSPAASSPNWPTWWPAMRGRSSYYLANVHASWLEQQGDSKGAIAVLPTPPRSGAAGIVAQSLSDELSRALERW